MKKVSIIGAGESGVSASLLAKSRGIDAFLTDGGKITPERKKILDAKNIDYEEGGHTLERILDSDEVIISPGIPSTIKLVKDIVAKGIPIISEIEFASRFTTKPIVAITGTNGKTTTSSLIYHILASDKNKKISLSGNIGNGFSLEVIKDEADIYVVEVSNFQLDYIQTFKPFISILLNITPDHLDRYDWDFSRYIKSKLNILKNIDETDYFIFNADDPNITNQACVTDTKAIKIPISLEDANKSITNVSLENDNWLCITDKKLPESTTFRLDIRKLNILGKHNLFNAACAIYPALIFGYDKELIEGALSTFKPVEHRIEFVREIEGVRFYNDSKATNVDSAIVALRSFTEPIIWIAGGIDKGNDYTSIVNEFGSKIKLLISLGSNNANLEKAFDAVDTVRATNMEDAIAKASEVSEKGDVVLLSPACASFDLYKNYEERGEDFKKIVSNQSI